MPAGFPKGQVRFTNAKVIVARAFPPPGAQEPERRPRLRRGQLWARDTRGRDRRGQCTHTCEAMNGVGGVAPRAYIGNYRALVGTDSGLS